MAVPCKIYMFFGEKIIDDKLVVFKTADKESFTIEGFSCLDLKAALPAPAGITFDKFDLTEAELLSLTTFDSWIAYCMHSSNTKTLGYLAFESIYGNAALRELVAAALDAFTQIGAAGGGSEVGLAGTGWRRFQGPDFQEKWAKMKTVFGWLQNIMETFYGKQFLVKVGNDNGQLISGICVKDKFGNKPAINVKVDGEGGPFVASDTPAGDGGWPARGQRQILGLDIGLDTEIFHSDDSRITTFVKMGPVKSIEKKIKKAGRAFKWDIDIERIGDTGSWKTKTINGVDTLYAKADVTGQIYFLVNDRDNDPGHYVHFTMGAITLKLSKEGLDCDGGITYAGLVAALSLFADHVVGAPEKSIRDGFCQEPPKAGDKERVGASAGRDHLNVLGMRNLAIFPVAVAIPFKSHIFVYGPWSFVANPIGGTIVAPNNSLCPWNFAKFEEDDGYDRMNLFGRLIASDGPKDYNKTEEGSITVACLPNFNMGAAVGGNTALLKDISINFGSGGVTTTYQFSTYSAKFGEPARHLLDAWSSNYKMLTKLKNYFKNERLKVVALANQNRVNVAGFVPVPKAVVAGGHIDRDPDNDACPGMLLISAYLPKDYYVNSDGGEDKIDSPSGSTDNWDPCYYTSPEGTIDPAPTGSKNQNDGRSFSGISEHTSWEFVQPNTYSQLSVMTLDGLFSPVSLTGVEGGKLPRLALYHNTAGAFIEFKGRPVVEGAGKPINSKTKDEIPPFTLTLNKSPANIYNREINQTYLNAYTSKKILDSWDTRKNSSTKGFIIFGISYGSDWKKMSLGEISDKRGGDIEDRENQEDFRFSALKGPLMLQSWGYDTSGKPVPNAVDSPKNAEEGKFRKAGLTDNFMNNWLSNPKTWPVGPIDLRFDRERGVWVCPPGNKIVVAKLRDVLKPYGKVEAELVNAVSGGVQFYQDYTIWGPQGENVKENIRLASIQVYDYLGVTLDKGDIVYAYYDEGRYIILESSRSYTSKSFHICTTTIPPITPIRTILPSAIPTTSPVIYKFRNCCETDSAKTFSSPIIYQVINAEPRSVSLEVGRVFSAKIPSDAAPACFIITEKFSSSGSPPTYSSVTIIEPYDNCDSCAVIVGSCTPPTTIPLRPSAPTPTVATSCWCGLECLQTLENYDKTKTQALIHKEYAKDQSNKFIIRDGVTLDGCLSWENIVECSTPATPLPS